MYWVSVGARPTSLCHISISLYFNNTVKITADILLNGVEGLTKNINRGRQGGEEPEASYKEEIVGCTRGLQRRGWLLWAASSSSSSSSFLSFPPYSFLPFLAAFILFFFPLFLALFYCPFFSVLASLFPTNTAP